MFMTNFMIHYIFLVLVVYILWRDCNKYFIAFFFEGRILEFSSRPSMPSSAQFSFMSCLFTRVLVHLNERKIQSFVLLNLANYLVKY